MLLMLKVASWSLLAEEEHHRHVVCAKETSTRLRGAVRTAKRRPCHDRCDGGSTACLTVLGSSIWEFFTI
jgi:hypothetical protein